MDRSSVVDILNELLAIEQQNIARRMLESTVFITSPAIKDWAVVQRTARASRDHEASLVEAILAFGGAPGLRVGSANTADLHYQELHHSLPRLVAWFEDAINTYTHGAKRVETEPEAGRVVSEILECHRQELMSIRQLCRPAASDEGKSTGPKPDALP